MRRPSRSSRARSTASAKPGTSVRADEPFGSPQAARRGRRRRRSAAGRCRRDVLSTSQRPELHAAVPLLAGLEPHEPAQGRVLAGDRAGAAIGRHAPAALRVREPERVPVGDARRRGGHHGARLHLEQPREVGVDPERDLELAPVARPGCARGGRPACRGPPRGLGTRAGGRPSVRRTTPTPASASPTSGSRRRVRPPAAAAREQSGCRRRRALRPRRARCRRSPTRSGTRRRRPASPWSTGPAGSRPAPRRARARHRPGARRHRPVGRGLKGYSGGRSRAMVGDGPTI